MKQNANNSDITLQHVADLLDSGDARGALALIDRVEDGSLKMRNARGVALLRLGAIDKAIDLYRRLVLMNDSICLRDDVPTHFKTNYALALLLAGNLDGCRDILDEVRFETHPYVRRLRNVIICWKKNVGLWRRLWMTFTSDRVSHPVEIDFAPGDLFDASADCSPAAGRPTLAGVGSH